MSARSRSSLERFSADLQLGCTRDARETMEYYCDAHDKRVSGARVKDVSMIKSKLVRSLGVIYCHYDWGHTSFCATDDKAQHCPRPDG
jgi:hypothetical protein